MKTIASIFSILLLTFCHGNPQAGTPVVNVSQQQTLRQCFYKWQKEQIANKNFWAADSCNMGWFANHNSSETGLGFPQDSSQYHFSYADVNNDGMPDQLVTFAPDQCDGGNALMWAQFAVLTVSNNSSYQNKTLDADSMIEINAKDKSGMYLFDSIGANKVYLTLYKYKEQDPRCCPSVKQKVVVAYDNQRVISAK